MIILAQCALEFRQPAVQNTRNNKYELQEMI